MSVGVHTDCHEPRVRDHFLCRITIVVMHRCASWTIEKTEHQRIDAFRLWCLRRLLRVSWTARRSSQTILKKINPNIHWKGWCWSWSSNNLATWCKEPTHWKRPWCWERLRAGEDGDRGWDGWMASLTQWTWVWANSGRQWRREKLGVLQSMGSQRVGYDWVTELNQRGNGLHKILMLEKIKGLSSVT